MKTAFIYALCEPGTRTVRYIGKTSNPKNRLRQHINDTPRFKSYLGNWMFSVVDSGKIPEMIVLREVPYEKWEEVEIRYIRIARALKLRLVNGTKGGGGVDGITPEVREKLRVLNSGEKNPMFGKHHTEEVKARISASLSGDKSPMFGGLSQKHLESMRNCQKKGAESHMFGVPKTEAQKARLSETKTGALNPMFGKVGALHHLFGRKRSVESIEKQKATRRANRLNKKGGE